MRVQVPSPPVSAFAPKSKPRPSRLSGTLVEAFDSGFVGRIIVSMSAVGALLMLGILSATHSSTIAGSFGFGIGLGALLLKSQEWFVCRVLGPKAKGETNLWGRAPLAFVLTFKYLLVGAVMGILIELGWLNPVVLAQGFIVGQIVIVGKVLGRFLSLKMRSDRAKFRTHVA